MVEILIEANLDLYILVMNIKNEICLCFKFQNVMKALN